MMMMTVFVLLKISYDCYCDLLTNLLFLQQYTANIIILIINDIAKLTPITAAIEP